MTKTQTPTPEPVPVAANFDALVDTWFVDHFHNRAPAVDHYAYNLAFAAAQDLKKRLAALPNVTS